MKKLTFLILLSLAFSFSFAQHWELFPLNQKMYFSEDGPSNARLIDLYLMDDVFIDGQDTLLNFRKNIDIQGAGSCYHEVADYIDSLGWYGPHNYTIDFLVKSGDEVFYYWENSANPFYFIPTASVGQSWDIVSTYDENDYSTITITCSDIQLESFLGISDSVKTFTLQSNGSSPNQTPIENFVIKLSKNFGLIEFVPFIQFLYHPDSEAFKSQKLIGLEKAGIKYGFEPPGFEDYFHLSEGDILLWHHYYKHVSPEPAQNSYYRDSITQAIITPDSVTYLYDRVIQRYDGDTIYQQGKSVTYRKHNLQNIINTPPNDYGFGNNQFGEGLPEYEDGVQIWKSDYLSIDTDTIPGDTVIGYSFVAPEFTVDTTDCGIYIYWDLSYSFRLNTYSGITQYCANNWSTDCTTLIGSIIDGVQTGSLDFPSSIREIPNISTLEIYPNPASDAIIIGKLNQPNNSNYKILTSTGQLVKQGKLNDNTVQINELAQGLYFLLIFKNESLYRGMFVKQ